MKNELLHIGGFTIYGYGLMIAIGVLSAYMVGEYRAKRHQLDPNVILAFILWTVAGGLVGAKLLYYLTIIDQIIADPRLLLNIGDGFVVFGGILAGLVSAWIFCRVKKISFYRYFDLLVPSVALGQAFGRIGCFLAGCCYGAPTELPIGVIFPEGSFAPAGVRLLPTQLMSSGLDFLHFLILLAITGRKKGDGQVLGAYLLFYSVGRFVLEFFRGDLIRGNVGVLSTSQFISIFTAALGIILIVKRNGKVDTAYDPAEEVSEEE